MVCVVTLWREDFSHSLGMTKVWWAHCSVSLPSPVPCHFDRREKSCVVVLWREDFSRSLEMTKGGVGVLFGPNAIRRPLSCVISTVGRNLAGVCCGVAGVRFLAFARNDRFGVLAVSL